MQIFILFRSVPVNNLIVTSQDITYYAGEVINCTADGYPSPTYIWIDLNNTWSSVNGSSLYVTESMVGSNYTLLCIATNDFDGRRYTANTTISFFVDRGKLFFGVSVALDC